MIKRRKKKGLTTANVGEDAEQLELLYNVGGSVKVYRTLWQRYANFYKIKNIPSYEPAITLPKCNEKIYPQTCTWMLIAGLFITATNQKQKFKYPSAGEWVNYL